MWTKVLLLLGLYWAATASVQAQLNKIRVHSTEPYFLDEYNRVRIFHGVNTVYKGFPWYPLYMLEESVIDNFQKYGFNVIRLGSMWSGAEPAEGQYNATYIEILQGMVRNLADHGLYTMLDMHQDVMSTKYNSYDGIPRWVVDKFPEPTNPYPWPLTSVPFWEMGYLTQACSEGMQHVYDNYAGALDSWVAFWGHMTENFKGMEGMLGYNLINEPWIGDYFTDNLLVLPGMAGRRNLQPSYDKINDKIRELDTDGIIFYEPVFYGQAGVGDIWGAGFQHVPGGDTNRNISAYSYHMYCWALEFISANASDEDRQKAKEFCDNVLIPQMLQAQSTLTAEIGGAAILTEFGLCKTTGEEINFECRTFMDLCDDYLQSWVEWGYFMGSEPGPDYAIWVRTYAQAIAGVPTLMQFDADTNEFIFQFSLDTSITAPTVIYAPALRYINGYNVELSADLTWQEVDDTHIIHVTYTGEPQSEPVEAEVRITAK